MKYDPKKPHLRNALAHAVVGKLIEMGFSEIQATSTDERIFERPVKDAPGRHIRVYTSTGTGMYSYAVPSSIAAKLLSRGPGGRVRCLGSRRVNRVGELDSIVARMTQKIADLER